MWESLGRVHPPPGDRILQPELPSGQQPRSQRHRGARVPVGTEWVCRGSPLPAPKRLCEASLSQTQSPHWLWEVSWGPGAMILPGLRKFWLTREVGGLGNKKQLEAGE